MQIFIKYKSSSSVCLYYVHIHPNHCVLIHSGHYCSDLLSLNGDFEIELEVVFQWDLYLTSLYPLHSIFSVVRLKAGTISSCRISLPKTSLCCQLESNILAIWNKPHNTDCSTYTANTEGVCDHKSFATTFAISLAAPMRSSSSAANIFGIQAKCWIINICAEDAFDHTQLALVKDKTSGGQESNKKSTFVTIGNITYIL